MDRGYKLSSMTKIPLMWILANTNLNSDFLRYSEKGIFFVYQTTNTQIMLTFSPIMFIICL